jgi:hypothetical protein
MKHKQQPKQISLQKKKNNIDMSKYIEISPGEFISKKRYFAQHNYRHKCARCGAIHICGRK